MTVDPGLASIIVAVLTLAGVIVPAYFSLRGRLIKQDVVLNEIADGMRLHANRQGHADEKAGVISQVEQEPK